MLTQCFRFCVTVSSCILFLYCGVKVNICVLVFCVLPCRLHWSLLSAHGTILWEISQLEILHRAVHMARCGHWAGFRAIRNPAGLLFTPNNNKNYKTYTSNGIEMGQRPILETPSEKLYPSDTTERLNDTSACFNWCVAGPAALELHVG